MKPTINIYCDESCHLENDHQKVMVIGAIWCPLEKTREIAIQIRNLKQKYNLPKTFEIKWTKVSPSKQDFYQALLEYFFNNPYLHFRAIIIPDKDKLQHKYFDQDHDTWYYKMYFNMLKVLLSPEEEYRIYLDIKDTRSADKTAQLHEVLCNNIYDFSASIITRLQTVVSHEVEQIQLADFLSGIICYANRGLNTSSAKLALVEQMRKKSGYVLNRSTLYRENKVNLFRWHASNEE